MATNINYVLDNSEHPNVGFKLGTDNALQALLLAGTNAGATHGTFYLTEDTHRLYIGNYDGSVSAVNEGIIFVDRVTGATGSETQLPTPGDSAGWKAVQGQFYYCRDKNVLCVASGERWVQINPDTYVSSFTVAVTTTTDSTTGDVVSATITDTVNQANHSTPGIPASPSSNFSIGVGSSNLHMSVTGRAITLTCDAGATYTFDQEAITNGVRVHLKGSNNDDDYFDILKNTTSGCAVTPSLDANGNIILTGGTADTFTLSIADSTSAIGQTLGLTSGQYALVLSDSNNKKTTLALDPTITLNGTGSNSTSYHATYNSTTNAFDFSLPVYTASEIDSMLAEQERTTDAMYFAGTIGSASGNTLSSVSDLATLNSSTMTVKNGATYKFTEADAQAAAHATAAGITIDGLSDGTIEVGDLIIVTGTEYTSGNNAGYLDPSTLHFHYVPSGDDADLYYTPDFGTNSPTNGIKFTKSTNTSETHQLTFAAGNVTAGSATSTPPVITQSINNRNKTIYIDHATISANGADPQTAIEDYGPTLVAITGVDLTNGHVTGYDTTSFTVKPNLVNFVTTQASAATVSGGSGVKLVQSWKHANGTARGGAGAGFANNWQITSTSLNVGVNAAGSLNTAGSAVPSSEVPADIKIDLIWGSF